MRFLVRGVARVAHCDERMSDGSGCRLPVCPLLPRTIPAQDIKLRMMYVQDVPSTHISLRTTFGEGQDVQSSCGGSTCQGTASGRLNSVRLVDCIRVRYRLTDLSPTGCVPSHFLTRTPSLPLSRAYHCYISSLLHCTLLSSP